MLVMSSVIVIGFMLFGFGERYLVILVILGVMFLNIRFLFVLGLVFFVMFMLSMVVFGLMFFVWMRCLMFVVVMIMLVFCRQCGMFIVFVWVRVIVVLRLWWVSSSLIEWLIVILWLIMIMCLFWRLQLLCSSSLIILCGVYGSGVWIGLLMLSMSWLRLVGCSLFVFFVGLICLRIVFVLRCFGSGSCMMQLWQVGLVLSLLIRVLMFFCVVFVGSLCWIEFILIVLDCWCFMLMYSCDVGFVLMSIVVMFGVMFFVVSVVMCLVSFVWIVVDVVFLFRIFVVMFLFFFFYVVVVECMVCW